MLAPSTLNMLPKFELAPILMYFVMLPKTLRPSMTPSSSTTRLFSSRMMSADSLAMSTAVSTEMPTSAALSAGPSLMPSPRKPTTCPLRCSASMIARLLRRRDLGEHRRGLGQARQLRRAISVSISLPSRMRSTGRPTSWQILRVTISLSPVRILTCTPLAFSAAIAAAARLLRRIQKRDVAEQRQAGLVGDANRPPAPAAYP